MRNILILLVILSACYSVEPGTTAEPQGGTYLIPRTPIGSCATLVYDFCLAHDYVGIARDSKDLTYCAGHRDALGPATCITQIPGWRDYFGVFDCAWGDSRLKYQFGRELSACGE